MKILLVEDEKILRISLDNTLKNAGYAVLPCSSGAKAITALDNETFDVVLTDIRLPEKDGMEILHHIKSNFPDTKVIMMTAFGSVESAVDALKKGASDYLTKPFSQDELLLRLAKIKEYQTVVTENIKLKQQLDVKTKIIGNSPLFLTTMEKVKLAATGDHTILIEGESGSGKEMIVDYIHETSSRTEFPLIKVNCSALSENLFESELFGHEKGAFTGALKKNIGRFERANNGTLFLDDIDDLSLALQVNLLRAIQEGEIERVGGNKTIPVDVRIVAAAKISLREKMKSGEFRDDLFFRLNVVHISIPRLNDRIDDIPLLTAHFLEKHGSSHHITPAVMEKLKNYSWPGNVRELENVIIQMIALAQGDTLVASLLPSHIRNHESIQKQHVESSLKQTMAESEKNLIMDALEKCKWRQKDAAELLGVPRTTLRSKMDKFGLSD